MGSVTECFPLPGRPDHPSLLTVQPVCASLRWSVFSVPPPPLKEHPSGPVAWCACVFRCQRLGSNTGSFFSSPYGRLYSNLILNHPDGPTLLPLLWQALVALLMLDFLKTKKGRGKASVFRARLTWIPALAGTVSGRTFVFTCSVIKTDLCKPWWPELLSPLLVFLWLKGK